MFCDYFKGKAEAEKRIKGREDEIYKSYKGAKTMKNDPLTAEINRLKQVIEHKDYIIDNRNKSIRELDATVKALEMVEDLMAKTLTDATVMAFEKGFDRGSYDE